MSDVLAETPIEELPLDRLRLDPQNPRLLKFRLEEGELDDISIVRAMLARFDPEPVGRSIVEYGFFATEPLIVYPDGDNFIVAEGNRRLVAVRLLLEGDLRKAVDAEPIWDDLANRLAEHEDRRARLATLPCQQVKDREAAAPIIGYRHIVGILKWDPFEKAAFVVGLLGGPDKRDFDAVSEMVGESPRRIQRYLRDWLALEQAERNGVDVTRARREFGRWERAIHSKGVREYVGARSPTAMEPDSDTAYEGDDEKMKMLLSFLYGEAGGPDRIFTDTRRIDDLSVALQSEEGREVLEERRDLDDAFEVAGGRLAYVRKGLAKALTGLQQAAPDYPEYADEEEVIAAIHAIKEALARLEEGAEAAEQAAAEGDEDYELEEDEGEDSEIEEEEDGEDETE
jgi:hypothetical protein